MTYYYYSENKQFLPNQEDGQVDESTYNSRISTCEGCEFYEDRQTGVGYDFETEEYESYIDTKVCTECNCEMTIKAKYQIVKCPLGKW